MFKENDKVNKHVLVFNITKDKSDLTRDLRQKFDTENSAVWSEFNTKLCNVIFCFEGSALQGPFSHLLLIRSQ